MRVVQVAIISAVLGSALLAQPPAEQVVKVAVVSTTGSGVPSKVWRRVGTAQDETRTDAAGRVTFSPMICSLGTAIRVAPINPFYANAGGWRPCASSIIVTLQPFGYAQALASVLSEAAVAVPELAASTNAAARVNHFQSQLHAASLTGDWPAMAFAANEISAVYRAIGRSDIASRYSGVAIHSGAQSIAMARGETITEPLLVQTHDQQLVESAAANRILRTYQTEQEVGRRGVWDRPTFSVISGMKF